MRYFDIILQIAHVLYNGELSLKYIMYANGNAICMTYQDKCVCFKCI